jgi:hypothetical protein
VTEQEIGCLEEISRNLSNAVWLWEGLPREMQDRINEIHNERASLGYCLRWGGIAIDEVLEYLYDIR